MTVRARCDGTVTMVVEVYRWRRGEPVAYVLEGKRTGDHAATGILGKIAVGPAGWTDLTQIQLLGQRWLRQQ